VSRSADARLAAHESWANTPDRAARTSAARAGRLAKFEAEARERLGPDASDDAVAAAAESARKAHYARMSRAGVEARKAS
jgi:hypothetical protein